MADRKELFFEPKSVYEGADEALGESIMRFAEGYKSFIDAARTERLAVAEAVKLAEARGFKPFKFGDKPVSGDKIYYVNRDKALMLAVIGSEPMSAGINLAAAHVDSPRLDLKHRPLYEDSGIALLKTHYYGGVKKYQWVTVPMALVGTVVRADGSKAEISIGLKQGEPQFLVTDLLIHLAGDQMRKKADEVISGENMNLLFGSRPDPEEGSDRVKLAVLRLLNEKYGITEEDFLSAELSAVPAAPAVDVGIDRSMVGGYGHDDRVCAYAELMAILDTEAPKKTAVCLLVDKEEIGSEGVTGMLSRSFDRFIDALCGYDGLYECFANSLCLSADVCNAFDPSFAEVSDKRNGAQLNGGVAIMKYTGSRGKSGSNDASAETVGRVRRMFAENGVVWQMGELGKVDQGGGGTVAKYTAQRDIDTIDAGVPVLCMHAPFEVISKADLYMTYKAMLALYGEK
ncbi:MAG: aminopeptidase [Oscillospiraceae bacterium]|nr:aminopeptidase [Oscillospiraceae bacterium]